MDTFKRAGEGLWLWLMMSLFWIFSSTLQLIAQSNSEHQEFLLIWSLSLIFWTINSSVTFLFILSNYLKIQAKEEPLAEVVNG